MAVVYHLQCFSFCLLFLASHARAYVHQAHFQLLEAAVFVLFKLFVFLAWWLFKILEQDGQKEVEKDQVAKNEEKDEVCNREGPCGSVMIVHDAIPIFSNKYNENGSQALIEIVEVLSWVHTVLFHDSGLVFVVIHDLVGVHLAAY